MTDDGQVVRMTQTEYYALVDHISRCLFGASGTWDFPWTGVRALYVVADEPQGKPK